MAKQTTQVSARGSPASKSQRTAKPRRTTASEERCSQPVRLPDATDWLKLAPLLQQPEGTLSLMEQYLKIRTKAGHLLPLVANPVQRRYEERRGNENIVLKARQMGLSTWIAGRFLLRTVLNPGTTTLMVAHTRESAESLFVAVARMWDNLPTELQETAAKRGRSNVGAMSFPAIDSVFRVASAAEPNAGRGLTVQNLHCSEVARWTGDAAATLAGLRAALAPGGELVLESTPNGAWGCFHAQWQQAETDGMVRHFFPWWMEPAYVGTPPAETTEEEDALVAREGLTAEQIGFRRDLALRFGALRSQEFAEDPVSCFRTSGSCFFETEILEARMADLSPILERRRGGSLHVWLPPIAGRTYIAGVDPAGGGSEGDFAAIQVIDQSTGMQCAELQALLSPRDLAHRLEELSREYNGAQVAIERNNHGLTVLAYLERNGASLNIYHGPDGMPGWLTGVASRPRALQDMAALLVQQPRIFASQRLLAECRSFVTDEHGRAAAARGEHDDLVMSMAIAQAVRLECRRG